MRLGGINRTPKGVCGFALMPKAANVDELLGAYLPFGQKTRKTRAS